MRLSSPPCWSVRLIASRFVAFPRLSVIVTALMVLDSLSAQETAKLKSPFSLERDLIAKRIEGRSFPSIFQAWNVAENVPGDRLSVAARHDLLFNMPSYFGLKWKQAFPGLGTAFRQESISDARLRRQRLLRRNPNMILLAELRYYEAPANYLPENHSWWMFSATGEVVSGWVEGRSLKLNLQNEDFRQHVAEQAAAVMKSGAVDGILLDSWHDTDPHRIDLLKRIRAEVGDHALILVNANDRRCPISATLINGHYMECARADSVDDWKRISETLAWAESHVRRPAINCVETGFRESRQDLNRMRATTTLSMTLSDGYALFADPNPLSTPDHLHNWYGFWDASLGKPVAKGVVQGHGAVIREFDHGFAIYNPPGNQAVTLRFDETLVSVAQKVQSNQHVIPSFDGDILLRLPSND